MSSNYNINRRKFLELFGCSCCGVLTTSCATVPITERKQLALYPESVVNNQAAKAYAKFKSKAEIIQSGKDIEAIINIGKKIEKSVSTYFSQKNQSDPTENFQWEYVLVKNDKVKNAW